MAKIYDKKSGNTILVSVRKSGTEKQVFAYDENIASGAIVNDSTASVDLTLEPVYLETVTEQVNRSKWLGSGIKFAAEFSKLGKIEIEKKPTKEVKKRTRVVWRKPSQISPTS